MNYPDSKVMSLNKEEMLREEIVNYGRLLYERGLTTATGGNISARLDDETILITPSGIRKGEMKKEDIVLMKLDGSWSGSRRPSIESPLHTSLYRREGIGAVIHAHPPCCTALAVASTKLMTSMLPEGVMILGEVPLIPYRRPGSEELADEIMNAGDKARGYLLEKHGALTVGRNLAEAFGRMEEMEFIASVQLKVMSLERPRGLSSSEMKELKEF